MEKKKKGSNTVTAVWELAQPIAESLSLRLWDVQFLKEGAIWYLRIIIDKDGGVNIDDCVDMHHAIDGPLDELDPIEQAYNLQVSSAGIERKLVRDEHFEQFLGADIKLRLQKAEDGVKEFAGVLKAYDKGVLTLGREGHEDLIVDKKACSWIRLDDFEGF